MGINVSRRSLLKATPIIGSALMLPVAALPDEVNDPLLVAINAYLNGLADFKANAPLDDEGADEYADISYGPPLAALNVWDQPAKSREGALKALQIAISDSDGVANIEAADRMVVAAIGFLEVA